MKEMLYEAQEGTPTAEGMLTYLFLASSSIFN